MGSSDGTRPPFGRAFGGPHEIRLPVVDVVGMAPRRVRRSRRPRRGRPQPGNDRAAPADRQRVDPALSRRPITGRRLPAPGRRSISLASLAPAIAVVASVWAPKGHAAGGQFAVDDAAILDVGTCLIETWWERADRAGSLLHLGAACRVGPVELALNADRIQPRDRAPLTPVGPQIKWAVPIDDRVSVGLVALVAWQGSAPHYAGATVYAPLTLRIAETLLLNVNVGQDWLHD